MKLLPVHRFPGNGTPVLGRKPISQIGARIAARLLFSFSRTRHFHRQSPGFPLKRKLKFTTFVQAKQWTIL